jgi:hypothetical protein
VIRYYDRARVGSSGGDPGATWWTTCRYNKKLHTVSAVRWRLALPRGWGARDARVVAEIPARTRIVYLLGRAAAQCEPRGSRCYAGGGPQLLFRDKDLDRSWFVRRECARGPERTNARFEACAG